MSQKIAIIGGGIAGLTASYLLNKDNDITLFEKSDRIGGNAYTITAKGGEKIDIAVAAFGKAGYDNFYRLLDELNVKTSWALQAYMSMENLDTKEGLYITPLSLKGLFRQKFALLNPMNLINFITLLKGVKIAIKKLDNGELKGLSFEEVINSIPQLSKKQPKIILLSALCLMSSMSGKEVLESPAEFFVSKLKKHNDVVSPRAVYSVRCMKNQTKSYVDALAKDFKDKIIYESRIQTVIRNKDGVIIKTLDENNKEIELKFDKIIFGCNADQALELLETPTKEEKEILGKWRYKPSNMVVHRDLSSFPHIDLIQSFNFIYTERDGVFNTSVSGGLRYLPGVPNDSDLISTQHANFDIDEKLVEYKAVLRTPIFDNESYATVKILPTLNGVNHSYYCGSHFGHGLHEAAIKSAIDAAKMLGAKW